MLLKNYAKNNRIINLRLATRAENIKNALGHKDNKLGLKGVSTYTQENLTLPYYSRIYVNGKNVFLGSYATPEEAHLAYKTAAENRDSLFNNAKQNKE